jgi:WD repeat-containing protein 45
MLWDDHMSKCVGELVFQSAVQAVRMRKDRVIVALQSSVFVHRLADMKYLDNFLTLDNPK